MKISAILAALVVTSACSGDGGNNPATSGIQSLCDPVSTDDLILDTQADVDDAAETEVVAGDLLVCGATDLESLSLPLLAAVGGNIIVFDNVNLTSISLPLLEVTGDDPSSRRNWNGFLIEGNHALTDVVAPMLREVDRHVWIADNATLVAFDLPALNRVHGALALRATQVAALDGFAELRFIGDALALYDNPEITDVTGFGNLVTVSGELLLTNNAKLATVTLPGLRTVGDTLEAADTAELSQLDLPALTTVGGDLTVTATGLANTDGFAALETVAGDLALTYNSALTDITLAGLLQVGGDLLLANNDALTTVDSDLLTYLGDSLILSTNDLLDSLSFAALAELAGNLVITDNPGLPTCAAESLRDDIGPENIGGEIAIAGNDDNTSCP